MYFFSYYSVQFSAHLKEKLNEYIKDNLPMVTLIHAPERLGLIRARILGANNAKGEVSEMCLIFK